MDDLNQLSQEVEVIKKGGLPPLFSFIITAISGIVAFIISFFFVYSGLRIIFGLGAILALFLSIGTFIILWALLGEIVTVVMGNENPQET